MYKSLCQQSEYPKVLQQQDNNSKNRLKETNMMKGNMNESIQSNIKNYKR